MLLYGGQLVQSGALTAGNLVSFVFYMQSLFDAFSSIGNIFAQLVGAVGAAEKVGLRASEWSQCNHSMGASV